MTTPEENLKLALKVLNFYGNKKNWELRQTANKESMTTNIYEDNGTLARVTVESITYSSKGKQLPCWLTEDLAMMYGYMLIPLSEEEDCSYIIQHRGNFLGYTMQETGSMEEATHFAFYNKFLALLALSKKLEKKGIKYEPRS